MIQKAVTEFAEFDKTLPEHLDFAYPINREDEKNKFLGLVRHQNADAIKTNKSSAAKTESYLALPNPVFEHISDGIKGAAEKRIFHLNDIIELFDNSPLGSLYKDAITGRIAELELIKSIGAPEVTEWCCRYAFDMNPADLKNKFFSNNEIENSENFIRESFYHEKDPKASRDTEELLDFIEVKRSLNKAISKYNLNFLIKDSEKTNLISVNQRKTELLVNPKKTFSRTLLEGIISHEDGHIYRRANGEFQDPLLKPVLTYTADELTEEGFAVVMEILHKKASQRRLANLHARFLVSGMALNKEPFVRSFGKLISLGYQLESAYDICESVYRVSSEEVQLGAYVVPAAYLIGARQILGFLDPSLKNSNLDLNNEQIMHIRQKLQEKPILYAGKTSLKHINSNLYETKGDKIYLAGIELKKPELIFKK